MALRRQLMEFANDAAKRRDEAGVMALFGLIEIAGQLLDAICTEPVRVVVAIGDAEVKKLEAMEK